MKKLVLILMLLFLALGAFPQESRERQANIIKRIGFDEADLTEIEDIVQEANRVILPAGAQIEVLQSELTYILTRPAVDLKDVERILRASLEWELKIRLEEIKKQLAIQEIIGSDTWAKMMQVVRQLRESGNLQSLIDRSPRGSADRRLLLILRNLVRK